MIDQVVGPQGSTVNEIKKSTGAEIEVSESSNKDEDSLVTISGSKSAVSAAKARVEEIIKNAENPDSEGDFVFLFVLSNVFFTLTHLLFFSFSIHFGSTDSGTTTEVIKCKTTLIGKVAGPQGSTVNEIKTSTGAEIEVSESSNKDEDSLVTISGPKNAVSAAKARVEEIIKNAETPDFEGDVVFLFVLSNVFFTLTHLLFFFFYNSFRIDRRGNNNRSHHMQDHVDWASDWTTRFDS